MKYRIGNAVIEISYCLGDFLGTVYAGEYKWSFNCIRPPAISVVGDDRDDFQKAAEAAVDFATYYTSLNRGTDVPQWAPDAATADAIEEATCGALDESGRYRGVEEL